MKLPAFLTSLPLNKITLYALGVLAAANVGQFLRTEYVQRQLDAAVAQRSYSELQLETCRITNGRNDQTIIELTAANEQWALIGKGAVAAARLAEKSRAKSEAEAERLRSAAKNQKLDGPSCDKILQTDIASTCPLLLERLRSHAKDAG